MDADGCGLEDGALFDAWRAGDSRAANTLVARHSPALRAFLYPRSPGDVDEAVQDVWLALASSRDRFQRRCSIRTYLFAIAKNQLRCAVRRRQRQSQLLAASRRDWLLWEPLPDLVDSAYDARRVVDALADLPEQLREPVVLYYFECLPARRVGELLGIPENTARSRVRRAKKVLAAMIASPS